MVYKKAQFSSIIKELKLCGIEEENSVLNAIKMLMSTSYVVLIGAEKSRLTSKKIFGTAEKETRLAVILQRKNLQ